MAGINHPTKKDIILRCYPTMTAREIEQAYGIDRKYVIRIACINKVRHTPETKARAEQQRRANISETFRHIYSMEKLRVAIGEPRKTNLNLRPITERQYQAAYWLTYRYGYIETDDPLTLFYDETTQRLKGRMKKNTEEYYTQTYGIRFMPDYQNQQP